MKTTGDHAKKEEDKPLTPEEKKKEDAFHLSVFHKVLIFLIIALVIAMGIRFYQASNQDKLDAAGRALLAQELTDRNITLYTTSTCPHCKAQKELFGEEIRYLRVVTCDIAPDEFCGTLKGVPAWRLPVDGLILGELNKDNLEELVIACNADRGCNLQNTNFTASAS